MTLQAVINSAQSIEVSRPSLVATTLSRSGRLTTGSRNWVKPTRITVSPKPIWRVADARPVIESIMSYDKHTEHEIYIGQGGANWTTGYQGSLTALQVSQLTVSTTIGNTMNLNLTAEVQALPESTVIFKPGDIVKPFGHRYPYFVTNTVTRGTETFVVLNLHRGYLPQDSYTPNGNTIQVGEFCSYRVKVATLPTYRFLPSQLVEFTGDFELIESVI